MSDNHLDKVLPFLETIDEKRREQFHTYFKNAPLWLIDSFSIEKMEKGRTFIKEGNPVDAVYFVGDGVIKATDYRIYGIKFDFILFTDVYAYGGMEIIMELDKYQTSLQTVTDCTILKIPRAQFAKWLKTDIGALRYESKLMGEYLLEQARGVRAFLFLQGADRLAMLFTNRYKKFAVDGVLQVKNDRQELSDFTGLSVKTITRAVQKLEKEKMITREGSRIYVNREQYLKMKSVLSEILFEEE